MKSRALFDLTILCSFIACKKPHSTPTVKVTLPYDSLLAFTLSTVPTNIFDANGVFCTRQVTVSLGDSLAPSVFHSNEAYFSKNETAYSYISSGSISLNGNSIPLGNKLYGTPDYNIYYSRNDNAWLDAGLNTWQVSGSSDIPAFTCPITAVLPGFDTAIVPAHCPLNAPLQITLNNTNSTNATYAYALLFNGDTYKSAEVAANGGTITLSSSLLNQVAANHLSDYGIYIDVVLYNIEYHYFNGKKFAFIQQRSCIKKITFY